jgi:hypothetical protein
MLKTPTPYPQVGSYGLVDHEGELRLARIIARDGERATIALPTRFGAGGNLTLDLAQVQDGTSLSDQEQAEYAELERRLAGAARPRKADLARFEALRLRSIRSDTLASKMRQAGVTGSPDSALRSALPGAERKFA